MTADPLHRLSAALAERYTIERRLGRGGMATVYLAQDLRHERPVALKVLHPELASSLGPDRFLREIKLVARLQHPHILSVHDSGDAGGLLWFAMPFVDGESLRERLTRQRQLPVEEALRITHEAARALDYAHRHGVIHRDIKPENILLSRDGDTLVADFGVGRGIGSSADAEKLTETGFAVGTPAYMSPEQAIGESQLDGRTDIYSLGCVLYEMLAGEPPFSGPTAQAIAARRLTELPRSLQPVRQSVSPGLEQVVMKSLARTPADRFATAAQMVEALDRVRADQPPSRGTPVRESPSAPTTKAEPARSRVSVWSYAAIGLVLLGAAATAVALRSRGASTLDPSLVAVAPFEVLDPQLGLWREGLVDLLSRNLDGAGPLRTVSPTVVVRRWHFRADRDGAAALGRETGAGLVVFGTLLGTGGDSVRLRATLLDVSSGRPLREVELRELAPRIDRAADSLTTALLRELGRTRPIAALKLTSFGSSSLPALKAFLQGEQHLRRTEWDSALAYYERAIELDSTFAPALRRASAAQGWVRTGLDSLSIAYAIRAGAHNHGLPPRDSILISADSLFASVLQAGFLAVEADSGWGARLHRLFATLDQATARYPNDPEVWFALGEANTHVGPYAGRPMEQQLDAFDRAIALDSAFAPAYIHPIELSARYGPEAIRKYLRPYLALSSSDLTGDGFRLLQRLLDSIPPAGANLEPMFEHVSDPGLFAAYGPLSNLADSSELVIRLARYFLRHPLSEPPIRSPKDARRTLARVLLSRGHLRDAYQLLRGWEELPLFADAALLGAVPAESAAASFRARLSGPASPTLVAAFPWWAARRDTSSLRTAEHHADSLVRSGAAPADRPLARYVAGSAAAYLALAQGDTNLATQRFLALERDRCPSCYFDRLTLAELLVARGRYREAWPIVQGEHPSAAFAPFPTEVLWVLQRGRVAERIGERDRAIRSYSWAAGMWRNADPELQPYVKEAREALSRLTAERQR
jgi:eukaryotic-like serine/threonine-protein kinase